MKEKTKLIILILVFVLLLILINNFMKDKSTNIIADNEKSKQSNNTAESNVIDVYEENFEKEVLNSDKRVLIDNGKEVDRSIGLIDKESLLKFIGK